MKRQAFAFLLADTYDSEGEYLIAKYPSFLVDVSYELTNGRGEASPVSDG